MLRKKTMGSSKKGSPETAGTLLKACAQNLPLDLRVEGDKPAELYKSRFLRLDDSKGNPILLIEAPTLKGNIVPIRPGQNVRISFSHNGYEYAFASQVLGRTKFELNPQLTVTSLELLIPEQVSSGGKRGFYRIPLGTAPSEVALSILAKGKSGKDRVRSREKGTLTDIGGGGLGFRMPEGKSLLLSPGTRLLLQFPLPGDNDQIKLPGRICFSLRRPELREAFFGVQFTDVDTKIEYKQDVDKILHFVAEQQRQLMRERADTNQ